MIEVFCWNPHESSNGFTVIEAVVTLAIVALIAALAIPSFNASIQDAKLVTTYNELVQTFRFARSEATKRSIPVSVCARATNNSCGSNWNKGWLVFTDSSIASGTDLVLDSTDTIIRVTQNKQNIDITARAVIRPDDATSLNTIQFNAQGRTNWDIGTIVACDDRGETKARAMAVSGTGMIRNIRSSTGVTPKDAMGTTITCP